MEFLVGVGLHYNPSVFSRGFCRPAVIELTELLATIEGGDYGGTVRSTVSCTPK